VLAAPVLAVDQVAALPAAQVDMEVCLAIPVGVEEIQVLFHGLVPVVAEVVAQL
jgi:hypothetical protein